MEVFPVPPFPLTMATCFNSARLSAGAAFDSAAGDAPARIHSLTRLAPIPFLPLPGRVHRLCHHRRHRAEHLPDRR